MKAFFNKPYIYLLIVVIGIGLKFYKLDEKFFWDDEIATVLHTSGIPMDEYEKKIPVNTIFSRSYFDKILALNDRHLNIFDQITGLTMMPQLTPGHYYYLIFWVRLFGDGYMSYRYFSVFIFLLSLPFLFLLTKKLFHSSTAGWIAVSLYAVSPFFQAYSQEARYYILWGLAIIIIDYLLLMASEKQNRLWWGLYAVAGALAIHTTILFSLVFLMHIIYYFTFHKKDWKPFVISLGIIFLCALPWLTFIYINRHNIENSLSWQLVYDGHIKLFQLILFQLKDLSDVFFNMDIFKVNIAEIILHHIFYLAILNAGIIVLFKKADKKQILFVMLATFVGFIVFITLDYIRNSYASSLPRYSLLNYIGIILLFTFAGKTLLEKSGVIFSIIFIAVIAGGIISSKAISDNPAFGNRFDSPYHVEDARELFSGNNHILIISDYQLIGGHSFSTFMSLINRSKDKNIDCIYAKPDYPDFATDFNLGNYDKVYAMYLSKELTDDLKKCFQDKMVIIKDRNFDRYHYPVYQIQNK